MIFKPTLVLSLGIAPLVSGQYIYTGNGLDDLWSNRFNWRLGLVDPSLSVPNDSFGIGNVDVEIPDGDSLLTEAIQVTNLDLATNPNQASPRADLDLNGRSLTVDGTLASFGSATLKSGSLFANQVVLNDGSILFDGIDVTADQTETSVGFTLANASTYRMGGNLFVSGDVSISSIGVGRNVITNNGWNLSKTTGPGIARVETEYFQSDGTVYSGSGRFEFHDRVTVNAGTIVSDNILIFKGETILGSPGFVVGTPGDMVRLEGPVTIGGTINSADSPFFVESGSVRSTNTFTGGVFDLAPTQPFIMIAGSQDPSGPSINQGTFIWSGGTLSNFQNTAVAPDGMILRTVPDMVTGTRELDGTLRNGGEIRHESGDLTINSNATLTNEAGSLYEIDSGTIREGNGASGHGFRNEGRLVKSMPPGGQASLVSFQAPLFSNGKIEVISDRLFISGPADLSGELLVDRTVDSTAFLGLGAGRGNEQVLGDVTMRTVAGGVIDLQEGDYRLTGRLTGVGDSGEVNLANSRSNLIVPTGDSAVLDFETSVPLVIGANLNTPVIRPTGSLVNEGFLKIYQASVIGPTPMINAGSVQVEQLLYLSSTVGGGTGLFSNRGIVDLTQNTSNSIRIREGGLFTNESSNPGGGPGSGGVVLLDEEGIRGTRGATSAEFLNRGTILSSGGGATVSAIFEQSASADALVESRSGRLFFNADATFLSGTMKTASTISFSEDATLGDVAIELTGGGEIELNGTTSGASADTYTLAANLEPTGEGMIRLRGGKVVPQNGRPDFVINATGSTKFLQDGGEMGAPGETLTNEGGFEQVSGVIRGNFINKGDLECRGDVDGDFHNLGRFELNSGDIAGTFANGEAATPGLGVMSISNGSNLKDDASLTSWNDAELTGSLRMGNRARILIERGTFVASTAANCIAIPGTTDHELEVGSNGELLWEASGVVSIDQFHLRGGKMEVRGGHAVNITSDIVTLNGGTMEVADSGRLTLRGTPGGSGLTRLTANGEVVFDLFNTATPAAVTIPVGGEITGGGSIEGLLTVDGKIAPGDGVGVFNIRGSMVQSATSATEVEVTAAGHDQLIVSGPVELDGILNLDVTGLGALVPGQNIVLVSGTSVSGTFDQVNGLQSPALFAGQALEIIYGATSVELSVTNTVMDFDNWAAGIFDSAQLADPNVSGPHADPDGDGVSNIFEFIGGTSPLTGGDAFRFTFEVLPAPIPNEGTSRYVIPVAPGRVGYILEVISLSDPGDPNDDQPVPHTGVLNATGDQLTLDSNQSFPLGSDFQVLQATLP